MSEQPISHDGEGERLHARQRRRFWMLIAGIALVGFIAGMVSFAVIERAESGGSPSPALMWLGIAGIAVAVLLFIYSSWRFFVSVDEVELADNLWGSLIGFYAYAIMLPAWWALEKVGAAPEPDHWLIYGSSLLVAMAAYFVRKWRARTQDPG